MFGVRGRGQGRAARAQLQLSAGGSAVITAPPCAGGLDGRQTRGLSNMAVLHIDYIFGSNARITKLSDFSFLRLWNLHQMEFFIDYMPTH